MYACDCTRGSVTLFERTSANFIKGIRPASAEQTRPLSIARAADAASGLAKAAYACDASSEEMYTCAVSSNGLNMFSICSFRAPMFGPQLPMNKYRVGSSGFDGRQNDGIPSIKLPCSLEDCQSTTLRDHPAKQFRRVHEGLTSVGAYNITSWYCSAPAAVSAYLRCLKAAWRACSIELRRIASSVVLPAESLVPQPSDQQLHSSSPPDAAGHAKQGAS